MDASAADTVDLPWTAKPLSCVTCRRRKIKCDKTRPECIACQRSKNPCSYRDRIRGASVKKAITRTRDTELLQRINRLEDLVRRVESSKVPLKNKVGVTGSEGSQQTSPEPSVDSSVSDGLDQHQSQGNSRGYRSGNNAGSGDRYLSNEFWANLGDEVGGLRELLDNASDEEEESQGSSPNAPPTSSSSFLFADNGNGRGVAIVEPSHLHREILLRFYFSNVDPVCRILHKPTIMKALKFPRNSAESNMAAHDTHLDPKAKQVLEHSMYFASVSSISAQECLESFGESQDLLLARYRHLIESSLASADFLNSMDLVCLQAFIIYLMAIRAHTSDRSSWTLIALAVRIAHSLGIHRDGDGSAFSAFEAEIRRRVWWQVIVVDMRCTEDRGSETVVFSNSFNTMMPSNLNDEDFGPESQHPLPERIVMTEMAFALISMDVSNTVRQLNYVSPAVINEIVTQEMDASTLLQREELVKQCTWRIENKYLAGYDPTNTSLWTTYTTGRILILKLWLALQYPLQRRPSSIRSLIAREQSLRIAVEYLDIVELVARSENVKPFLWWQKQYSPWRAFPDALAVALVELRTQPEGGLVQHAWKVIDSGYERWGDLVADSKEGMLWRPIKKLYGKAKIARQQAQEAAESFAALSLQPPGSMPNTFASRDLSTIHHLMQNTQMLDASGSCQVSQMQSTPLDAIQSNFPNPAYSTFGPPTFDFISSSASLADVSQNLGVDWLQYPDTMNDSSGQEDLGGRVNWDDWNEFIFDAGEVGALMDIFPHPNVYMQWPTQ